MVKYLLSSLLLAMLGGCGPLVYVENYDPRTVRGIPEDVRPYIQLFEDAAGRAVADIPFGWRKFRGERIGVCTKHGGAYPEVHLDPEYWAEATDVEREMLVFHELGHCDLGRRHCEVGSLMAEYAFDGDTYLEYREDYLDELFGGVCDDAD